MSDPSDPKNAGRGLDAGSDAPLDREALAAIEAEMRALRDAPVEPAALARMRAGLDARIEAASSDGASSVTPIASHPRWRWGAGLLAAAVAAAAALFLLLLPLLQSRLESASPGSSEPQDVVQEGRAPAPSAPDEALAVASDEELAIAIDYELLSDYDVIAQLDLLELLDEQRQVDGVASDAPEGRI